MAQSFHEALNIAAFFDLENLAIGVREVDYPEFDVQLVLGRLIEKGNVIVKKAYADWGNWSQYKRSFHEAAVEMIDIPRSRYAGKNSADIKMV
ncbi:MAG: NYN domain-containing protein, partial [Planctomycetota bacterium]|nr:NYN domain-containing protein [Planctomycetota bacterium]